MVTIRKATTEDLARLEELYRELEEDAVLYQPEHFVFSPKGTRTEQVKEILDSDTQTMLVAEKDGEVIGFAHLVLIKAKKVPCLKSETSLYLQDLVVTSEFRSQGIGTILMNEAKKYGKEKGADFFRTQVFPQNTDGLRFYERNGFSKKMITIECPF
ncbi:MAG: GNAT family N-acetyltransferase [Lachnospiraceae bacterium]|nr:GNAT family N-acetyltransferase [Lachnospiraceae bacterium]